MFCSNCGKQVDVGQKFCPYCGAALAGGTDSSSQSVNTTTMGNSSQSVNTVGSKKADKTKKKKKRLPIIIGIIAILVVVIAVVIANGGDSDSHVEISGFLNMDESEFLDKTGYKKTDDGCYPATDIPIFMAQDGKVTYVDLLGTFLDEDDKYKNLYIAGLQPGMKYKEGADGLADYEKLSDSPTTGNNRAVYTDKKEDCLLMIGYDPDSKKISTITLTVSSKDDIELIKNGGEGADNTENTETGSTSEDTESSSATSETDDTQDYSDSDTDANTDDSESMHQQIMDESGEFVFTDSNKVVEDSGDIEQLSDEELRIAINEIYARHGYHFKSADLQDYFNSCRWYEDYGITDQSEINDELNKYEKENLANLTAERDRRK